MPRFTVICEWRDFDDDEDADEIVVHAVSPDAALDKARKKWRMTIGAQWPNCRLTEAYVLTKEKLAEFL